MLMFGTRQRAGTGLPFRNQFPTLNADFRFSMTADSWRTWGATRYRRKRQTIVRPFGAPDRSPQVGTPYGTLALADSCALSIRLGKTGFAILSPIQADISWRRRR